MSISKLSVKNPVLVNILMVVILIIGIYSMVSMPKENMPSVDMGVFNISVIYAGASPNEIETMINNKIEDQLNTVDGIDYITSSAYESRATLTVTLKSTADIDKAWNDVNAALDKVNDLPEGAEDPDIRNISVKDMKSVCTIAIQGELSGNAMREIAEDIESDLLDINFISKIEIKGDKEREIKISVDKKKMSSFNLSFSDIEQKIKSRNQNLPGGSIIYDNKEFLLRTTAEFNEADEIGNISLKSDIDGNTIKLSDVAEIIDTYKEETTFSRLNGKNSISLYVYQQIDGNVLKIAENIDNYVKDIPNKYSGIEVTVTNDESEKVRSSIDTLSSSAIIGMILVYIILLIFIGWRNALFAALGIPFTFLMTFALMSFLGITINNLSLFALLLVLGIIVDDAIVVIENVHRHIEMGKTPKKAVMDGAKEMTLPVVSAVLTTVVAFLPMLLMTGTIGKFLSVFPKVVAIALFASLFEVLFILPSHLADFSKKRDKNKKDEHKLYNLLIKYYKKMLALTLRNRIKTVVLVFVLFILSFSAVAFRFVQVELMPGNEISRITLQVKTTDGAYLDKTDTIAKQIENYIFTMKEKIDIENTISTIGEYQSNRMWKQSTSYIEFRIDLVDGEDREYGDEKIKFSIRDYLNKIPEVESYSFAKESNGPPTGNDVEIKIKGKNLDRLKELGEVVKKELSLISGVEDIDDDFDEGKKEIQIIPDYDKLDIFGISVNSLSDFIRTATKGKTVSKLRDAEGNEYDITIISNDRDSEDLKDIENLEIKTIKGNMIKLKEIISFKEVTSLSQISHKDGKRFITITAANSSYNDEKNGKTKFRTTDEVMTILFGNDMSKTGSLSSFEKNNPRYNIELGGAAQQMDDNFNSLYVAYGVAILLIYMILGTLFDSYTQPLIVMMTIPFSFIGVIIGLFISGQSFSLFTLISVVGLAGIVVNDSLVLVDFINKERKNGKSRYDSLISAGSTRLRPILLTTLTTIFGLLPILVSTADSVQMWKPMAVSLSYGLGFATLLTLFVIPVIYSLVDSLSEKMKFKKKEV